jgi:predicted TIM-barrel fold metal-dependent hydrolase
VFAVADWLFSKVALRFPNLKIALSECGIGWVPFCIDRLDHMETRRSRFKSWQETDVTPTECLRRNFYFCALGEKAGFEMRDFIGVDHILVESDYPHEDSTWPDTQTALGRGLSGLPAEDVERMTCRNAAELFRKDLSGLEAWRRQVPA